ncbi:MAG: sulfur carrier protein ThiS [Calditrichaeota bacterium]|nr:MAG: sulfur carrier protein ThiS [Calditrichota bacterium]
MEVTINGKLYSFGEEPTVEDALRRVNVRLEEGIAVAVNFTVVPRDELPRVRLKHGDKLEVIHATAGG